jgi:glycosyltransferase involved in cell wall biosynthesis
MGYPDVPSLAGSSEQVKRLLIIVNVDWFFLSHRLPVALAARDAGFEVHVATTLTGPTEAIERHGFTLHPITFDRSSIGPIGALQLACSLYALIRKLAPDVVHLVTIKPVLLGGLAARSARVPKVIAAISGLGFVFTAHGTIASMRRTMVALLYRLALSRPNVRVIFQNEDDQALLQRHAAIRDEQVVRIRGSGVDVKHWTMEPLPPCPPVILMAARLLIDKGILEFIEAARTLRGHAGARFVLVGNVDPGNPTSLSREQIEQWATDGIIEWWGYRSDMPTVLASAHIVVLPSYREGLPKVLIEAAAAGRAVVTTDVPGCRDAIEAGRTGLLVPPRDAQALARAIRELIDDPARCRTMGESARLLAEYTFDIQPVIDQHLALYQK